MKDKNTIEQTSSAKKNNLREKKAVINFFIYCNILEPTPVNTGEILRNCPFDYCRVLDTFRLTLL